MMCSLFFRMTAPVMIVSVMLLVVGISTAWYIMRRQQEAAEVLSLNVASIRAAEELEIGMREIRTRINQFLLTGDRRQLEVIPELRQQTDRWLIEIERLGTTPVEQELSKRIRRGYAQFLEQFDELPESPSNGASDDLRELAEKALTQDILRHSHAYLDFNEQVIQTSSERGEAIANRMALGLLLLGTCGPMAGLLAGFVITRRVSHSLVQLSVPVRDAAGKLNEVVGPITVTAAANIEELETALRHLSDDVNTVVDRLQQSQREVLRAEQFAALGQLAAGVAHELRNPVQSIQLLVQSATEEGGTGVLEGHDLMVLQDAVGRVKRSVQAFLDFARPPTLEKRQRNVNEIVHQTIDLVGSRARRQGVRIRACVPDHPVMLDADADQLRQLVLNLLLNALDAVSGSGEISVAVLPPGEMTRADHGPLAPSQTPSTLTITVSDSGSGLPDALGDRIFEPFVTSKETGIGLGLPICRRIVESHGGTLNAANTPEGGACFTIQLPA